MKQSNFTKLSTLLLVLVFTISANQLFAQTSNGIFFQAVARDNFSNPAKDRSIYVQTTILQTTTTGTKVLIEEHKANTDATGVFSISIGNGTRVGGTAANLNAVDWSKGPFFLNLKVAITPVGGTNSWDYTKEWVDMGTTNFGAVPFSFYAASVAGFDTKLNVADSAKMLLPYAKTTSVNTLSTSVDNKLATKLNIADSTNGYVTPAQLAAKTFDQTPITNAIATKLNVADSTKYVTPTQLAAKTFDTTSLSSRINLKANASDITTALTFKASNSDLISGLNLKLNTNQKGVANGVASLNAFGVIPSSQLPPVTLSSTSVVGSELDMISLASATVGSIAIRTDLNKNYVLSATPASTLSNWVELLTPAAPVQTVNGYTGTVNISKNDIGLSDVNNTSDLSKPISTATQAALATKISSADAAAALNLKLDANKVGAVNGVASLNALGKVPTDQIPAISFSSVKVLGSQAEMLALSSAVIGSVVIRTDVNKNYVLSATPASTIGNWIELLTPAPPVQTVNGYTGNISITKTDLGLGNVQNTSDADKPISIATQAALDSKPTLDFVTTSVITGNATNTTDISTLKSTVSSNTLSITSLTTSLASKAPLNKTIRNAEYVSGITSSTILTDANSGNIIYTQWAQKPVFPESLSDGFQCTIVNYSGGAIVSNTLSNAKFYTNSSAYAGASTFTIPSGGSATIYAIKINGVQRYYVSAGDQASSATIADGSITNAKLAGSIVATKLLGTDISTVGTITSGTWSATTIDIVHGGTGAITAAGAIANLGAENTSNKSTSIILDANSLTKYPSVKLVKDYIDVQVGTLSGTTVSVTKGGTGATSLTGYLKGNGTSSFTASNTIPASDITGLIKTINGASPASDGNVAVSFGSVTTGTLALMPSNAASNGNIFVVSNDGVSANNGRTFISDGINWNEVTSNQSATDARYLQLSGGTLNGNLIIPSNKTLTITDIPTNNTDATNKNYVDAAIANYSINDATTSTAGKIQLTGDLAGIGTSATNPKISSVGGSTAALINSAEILANAAVSANTSNQIVKRDASGNFSAGTISANLTGNVSGNVTGNVSGTSQNVTGIVSVANGGTGTSTLTGYVKGNGSSILSATSTIPASDIIGLIKKVNGNLPDADGNIALSFGTVSTGTLSNRPVNAGTNGNIYVVSGDATTTENGRTFISDGTNWKEVTSNQSATDARYLKLSGGTMAGNIIIPTSNKITLTDAPTTSTDAVNKAYVDGIATSSTVADATTSSLGKIQLTGDLAGTGTSANNPKVSSVGGSTAALINSAEIAANAATYSNTVNQIVKRDASGNFSAGTITANVTGNISGNSTNVTGIISGTNGGTGIANTGKTITLGGNFETGPLSGNGHSVKFVTTAATTVTLPTSGTLATIAQVDLKELLSNKSTSTDLGNTSPTDDKYPSQKAVKSYIDNKAVDLTSAQSVGGAKTLTSKLTINSGSAGGAVLEVNGASTNTVAFNGGSATTIDFTKSNLAYTTASAGNITLTGMKEGGTYTLAVQGAISGTAAFAGSNPSATAFTFKSINNAATTASKHTLYTFIVMGTTVYYSMITGL
jgi:hypothetical protein